MIEDEEDTQEAIVGIDMKPIYERIEEHLKKKLKELKDEILDEVADEVSSQLSRNFHKVQVEDVISRLEKIEDWKLDIEQGWVDINK